MQWLVLTLVIVLSFESTTSLSQRSSSSSSFPFIDPISLPIIRNTSQLPNFLPKSVWPYIVTTGCLHSPSDNTILYLVSLPNNVLYLACWDKAQNAPRWVTNEVLLSRLNNPEPRPNVEPWMWPEDLTNCNGRSFQPIQYGGKELRMDRGHLAPNGDFRMTEEKVRSFIIVNRAPHYSVVNSGAWSCIEEALRIFVRNRTVDKLLKFTVLNYQNIKTLENGSGGCAVGVPTSFNLVVYVGEGTNSLASGFCIEQDNLSNAKAVFTTWSQCPTWLKLDLPIPTNPNDATIISGIKKSCSL